MKKRIYLAIAVNGLLLMLSIFNSCKQEELYAIATVETNQVTSITEATATCVGIITSDGGSEVTKSGFCWSTSPTPTIENDTTIAASDTSVFSSSIRGLTPGTTYYVRAYAVNKGGVAYGTNVIFSTKTLSIATTPISVSLLTATSAIGGGNIISDGESNILTVIARGVCWNTFPSPTIENRKTNDGVGGGRFTSRIDSLSAFTTYYVRAYATNGNGTIYGDEITFTTQSGVIELSTSPASPIMANNASSGGTISSDGGSAIISRGVCWSTSPNPTIVNNKTTNGIGTGSFTSIMSNLVPLTTYYLKAYATNDIGTFYGSEVSFTTQSGVVGLTTSQVFAITSFTATCGGSINSDGGEPIIARGVCWGTTLSPTIADSKTNNGTGLGSFTSRIMGLSANTLYYVRAYSINSVGTTYGNETSFTTQNSVSDIDGNVYSTVKIGTQVWMAENLKTTKFNDGTSIPNAYSTWDVITTPGYCYYNNIVANINTYGLLYNWYVVETGKLAPSGWHIPTDAECTILEDYLIANGFNYDGTTTENKIAKSLAATTSWATSSGGPSIGNDLEKNNTSGFTALPSGYRDKYGTFYEIGTGGYWWTSTKFYARYLYYGNNNLYRPSGGYRQGYPVRCVKD